MKKKGKKKIVKKDKSNIKSNGNARKSRVSGNKQGRNKETNIKKVTKKKTTEKKYDNFIITYTAIKIYEYNRPDELEIFTRSYPTVAKMTLASFRKRFGNDAVGYEIAQFTKIADDTEHAVSWSNWIYEMKAGDEDETHGRVIKGKVKDKYYNKKHFIEKILKNEEESEEE